MDKVRSNQNLKMVRHVFLQRCHDLAHKMVILICMDAAGHTLLFGYDQDQLEASRVGDPCLIDHIIIVTLKN